MNYSLIQLQSGKIKRSLKLLIHLGEISGDMFNISPYAQEVWRVSEDGEIRDPFKKLVNVFEMDETFFFYYYAKEDSTYPIDEYPSYKEEYEAIIQSLPDLPFSNIWMASVTSGKLPEGTIFFAVMELLQTSTRSHFILQRGRFRHRWQYVHPYRSLMGTSGKVIFWCGGRLVILL